VYGPFALAGFIAHLPLYLPISLLLEWKARGSEHYDSIRVALLILAYPFYLAICVIIIYQCTGQICLSLFLPALFPLTARAYLMLKRQF